MGSMGDAHRHEVRHMCAPLTVVDSFTASRTYFGFASV